MCLLYACYAVWCIQDWHFIFTSLSLLCKNNWLETADHTLISHLVTDGGWTRWVFYGGVWNDFFCYVFTGIFLWEGVVGWPPPHRFDALPTRIMTLNTCDYRSLNYWPGAIAIYISYLSLMCLNPECHIYTDESLTQKWWIWNKKICLSMADRWGLVILSWAALMDFRYLRFHVIPFGCLPMLLMKLAWCGWTTWRKHFSLFHYMYSLVNGGLSWTFSWTPLHSLVPSARFFQPEFFHESKGGQNFFSYAKGGPEKIGDRPSQTDGPPPDKKW